MQECNPPPKLPLNAFCDVALPTLSFSLASDVEATKSARVAQAHQRLSIVDEHRGALQAPFPRFAY